MIRIEDLDLFHSFLDTGSKFLTCEVLTFEMQKKRETMECKSFPLLIKSFADRSWKEC